MKSVVLESPYVTADLREAAHRELDAWLDAVEARRQRLGLSYLGDIKHTAFADEDGLHVESRWTKGR